MTEKLHTGIPSLDVEPRRIKVWQWFLLLVALALIGWGIWGAYSWKMPSAVKVTTITVGIPPAAAPASAASVPAVPEKTTDASEDTDQGDSLVDYAVRRGDALSRLWPDHWKEVCELNKLANCHRIVPGQVLKHRAATMPVLRPNQSAKSETAKAHKPAAAKAPRMATPATNEAGEILYRRVNTAPLNGCGRRDAKSVSEEAWEVLGLSNDDRVYLRERADLTNGPRINITPAEGLVKLVPGTRLEQVTFCQSGNKVVARGPYRTAWSEDTAVYGEQFALPSGLVLVWMRNCYNWVIHRVEKQEPIAPPPPLAEPPVAEPPPPIEPPALPPVPTPVPVAEAPKGLCDRIDMAGAIGQHHVPRQNGDKASSDFLTFVLDCQQRLKSDDGSWGAGGKFNYSDWNGTANRGEGAYKGRNHLLMVSYRQIMDEGYDWGVAVGVGRQHESYTQGAYASRSDYHLVGATWTYNDYRRRLAGETWDVERQYYAGLTIPTSSRLSQSWFNQPLDNKDMPRLKYGIQAGARWWFYESEGWPVLPYLEAGLFVQHPTSASGNTAVGIADPDRIVGIAIGVDKDLQNGGDAVGAWMWWVDPFQGGRVIRAKVRKHQVITDAAKRGTIVEERNGYIESIKLGAPVVPAKQ